MRQVCTGRLHVALPPGYPAGDGTRAEVTYDLTALPADADLAGFAAGFDAMLAAWERDIAAAL